MCIRKSEWNHALRSSWHSKEVCIPHQETDNANMLLATSQVSEKFPFPLASEQVLIMLNWVWRMQPRNELEISVRFIAFWTTDEMLLNPCKNLNTVDVCLGFELTLKWSPHCLILWGMDAVQKTGKHYRPLEFGFPLK